MAPYRPGERGTSCSKCCVVTASLAAWKIIEYYEAAASLTAMDRRVIANMGAELGATTSFSFRETTRAFMAARGAMANPGSR
jgi:aconitase A